MVRGKIFASVTSARPLDYILSMEYIIYMWNVEFTDEFEDWWETMNEENNG